LLDFLHSTLMTSSSWNVPWLFSLHSVFATLECSGHFLISHASFSFSAHLLNVDSPQGAIQSSVFDSTHFLGNSHPLCWFSHYSCGDSHLCISSQKPLSSNLTYFHWMV
jgi:hypothetical protein